MAFQRGPRLRHHPKSVGSRPHAGRLERRSRRCGFRRVGCGGDRLRRGGFRADPGRVVSPGRDQAAARAHLDLAPSRGVHGASPAWARSPGPSPTPRCSWTSHRRQSRRRPPPPAPPAKRLCRGRATGARPPAASRSRQPFPSAARPPSSILRSAPRPSGWARVLEGLGHHRGRGRPGLRPRGRELHASLDGRHPRMGRPHRGTGGSSTRAPATTRRSGSSSRGRRSLPRARSNVPFAHGSARSSTASTSSSRRRPRSPHCRSARPRASATGRRTA